MCYKNSNISAFSGFMSPLHLLTGRTVSKIVRDQVAQAAVRRHHCSTARSKAITDGCIGLIATLVVLTEAELSLIGSSSLCNSNADDTSCRHCTYEIELLRLLRSGHILT